jgi:hypothetical protein
VGASLGFSVGTSVGASVSISRCDDVGFSEGTAVFDGKFGNTVGADEGDIGNGDALGSSDAN